MITQTFLQSYLIIDIIASIELWFEIWFIQSLSLKQALCKL